MRCCCCVVCLPVRFPASPSPRRLCAPDHLSVTATMWGTWCESERGIAPYVHTWRGLIYLNVGAIRTEQNNWFREVVLVANPTRPYLNQSVNTCSAWYDFLVLIRGAMLWWIVDNDPQWPKVFREGYLTAALVDNSSMDHNLWSIVELMIILCLWVTASKTL